MQRAAVVFNPVKVDVVRLTAAVSAAAATAGWPEPLWFETSATEEGQAQTREALARGATLVIAAGGDGTVRAVADVLRQTDTALAILPAGTGNLLARNLSLPLASLAEACAVAFTGRERAIDVGIATLQDAYGHLQEHSFLVMAGLGFDAAIIANTRPVMKRRFGWLAYVDGVMRTIPNSKKRRVHYSLDGDEPQNAHVNGIFVANCGLLPGGIELAPDALIDDALLDIVMMQPRTIFGWLVIWRRIWWENHVLQRSSLGRRIVRLSERGRRTELTYLRAATLRLTVDEPEPFELDGDPFGDVVVVDLAVEHRGLLVRVPHR